jgi:vacuolar-type H+-ATPase subunit H
MPDGGEGAVDVLFLLDRLEEILTTGFRVPMSARTMIDEQEALDIIEQMRLALPKELERARQTVAERDQILAEARERADRLLASANEQANRQLQDHQIALAAEAQAAEVLAQADHDGTLIRREADDYAASVLTSLARRLQRLQGQVQEGLDQYQHFPSDDEDDRPARRSVRA